MFRLLVQAGRRACRPARSQRSGTVQNTMSAHLKVLDHARAGARRARRAHRPLLRRHDRLSRPARLSDGRLLQRRAGAVPAGHRRPSRATAREDQCMSRPDLQRAVPVHRQFRAVDPCRGDPQPRRRRPASSAFSAGSHPKGEVHPYALQLLEEPEPRHRPSRARRAGTSSPSPARRRWISSSRSATMPPTRPARSGRASR